MNTSVVSFLILAMCLGAFQGCSFLLNDGSTSFASLESTQWTLEKIVEAEQELDPPADQDYQLYFQEEGKFNARIDCNSASGNYSFDEKGDIEIKLVLSTYAGCGPNSLYEQFSKQIQDTDAYEITEEKNRLVLKQSSDRSLVFIILSSELDDDVGG